MTETAQQLLIKHARGHALRTLDALHLATFVLISEPEWRFVVADNRLYAVALEEGLVAVHPTRDAPM